MVHVALNKSAGGWFTTHRFIEQVAGRDYRQAPEAETIEAVQRVVGMLYDLNRLALVTRYGDSYDRDAELPAASGKVLTDAGLVKALACVAYQCAEYLAADTALYAHLREYEAQLSLAIVSRQAEYEAAEWEVAA